MSINIITVIGSTSKRRYSFSSPNVDPVLKTVLISLKGTGASPYVSTGNWNHAPQNFSSGDIDIYGDNNSSLLSSIRDTDGNLTGFDLSIVSVFNSSDSIGVNSDGVYPANANRSAWENPTNGETRVFKITGLNNDIPYTIKTLSSTDGISTDFDITVTGTSGGGTVVDIDANGNVNSVNTFTDVYPENREITINVFRQTGGAVINVIEISWEAQQEPLAADYFHDTVDFGVGAVNLFIRSPYNVNNPPTNGWPLVLFYGGDGSDVSTTTVSDAAMSTSNNLTYTLSPTLGSNRVLAKSVRIKVNGTVVGYGQFGGQITGTGISSGSVSSLTSGTPTISVTFSSSQAGNTITIDYVHSAMLLEGTPMTVNQGDTLDERCIYVGVQNAVNNGNYGLGYFDGVVEHLFKKYIINPNRISIQGISRGGVFCVETSSDGAQASLLKTRYQYWIKRQGDNIGDLVTSDPSNSRYIQTGLASLSSIAGGYGSSFVWSNYSKIGTAFVHGTNDGVVTNVSYGIANAGNELSLQEYPQILNLWNVGHNGTVWHTNFANRKYATGGVSATAPWDWVDFLLKYSNDDDECATLHVEQAEKRRLNTEEDIIQYREALRKVKALPTGDTKTALLSRLDTLFDSISSGGTYYFINPHNFGNDEDTPPYNNITNMTTGNSVDNIVDISGGTSAIDFDIVSAPHATVSDARITYSNRNGYTGGFSKIASNSGFKVVATGSTLGFADLPAGTYNIRFWHNEGTGNFTNNATLSVTIDGVEKTQYSALNSLLGYIQFTDIDAADLTSISVIRDADRDTGIWLIELFKHP